MDILDTLVKKRCYTGMRAGVDRFVRLLAAKMAGPTD